MAPKRTLADIRREAENLAYELEEMAEKRPPNGAEITLAMRKFQEAGFYTDLAIKKDPNNAAQR